MNTYYILRWHDHEGNVVGWRPDGGGVTVVRGFAQSFESAEAAKASVRKVFFKRDGTHLRIVKCSRKYVTPAR